MKAFLLIIIVLLILAAAAYLLLLFYADVRFARGLDEMRAAQVRSAEVGASEGGIAAVRITGGNGLVVGGLLGAPRDGNPTVGILILGGVGTGKNAVRLAGSIPGALLLSVDYPLKAKLPGDDLFSKASGLKAMVDGTAESLPAVALGRRYLGSIDGIERVVLIGVSLGVPFAAILGVMEERPDAVALLYGGGEVDRIVERALPVRPRQLRWFLGKMLGRLLAPLDPVRFAGAVSPCPLLLVNDPGDPRIPAESVEALRRAAREPKKIVSLEGGHVLPEKEELLARVVGETRDWLVELNVLQEIARPDSVPPRR
jgi:hypothetical protein